MEESGQENINSNNRPLLFYIVFGVVFLVTLVLVVSYIIKSGKLSKLSLFLKRGKAPQASRNVLDLTSPVTSLSGTVDKVEENAIWVTKKVTMVQSTPDSMATPETKTITYKINVSDSTQIIHFPPSIPYLFKDPEPVDSEEPLPLGAEKSSLADFKPGQRVNINTNTDLRTLTTNEFEATSIELTVVSNTISGRITKTEGNKVHLKAAAPLSPEEMTDPNPTSEEKDYTVTVTSETEISGHLYTSPGAMEPQPKRYSLSDLKKEMQITVYTDVDTALTQQFTALRIEPVIEMPVLPPPVEAASPVETVESPTP